jgi:hypothetical protein
MASSAVAQSGPAPPTPQPALKPGQSAGIRSAQQEGHTGLALVGAGAILALVLAATAPEANNNQANSQSLSVTTSP